MFAIMSESQRVDEKQKVNVQSSSKFEDSWSEFNQLTVSDNKLAEDALALGDTGDDSP
jgi:hypothetical protein